MHLSHPGCCRPAGSGRRSWCDRIAVLPVGCFCAIASCTRLTLRRKRVGRIARQHRDVIALGGIESDLAGQDIRGNRHCHGSAVQFGSGRQAPLPRSHTAGTCCPMVGLPGRVSSMVWPASQESGPVQPWATKSMLLVWKFTPKTGMVPPAAHWSGAARRGRAAVGCAVRIHPESLVFFDDPAIVGKW